MWEGLNLIYELLISSLYNSSSALVYVLILDILRVLSSNFGIYIVYTSYKSRACTRFKHISLKMK